MDAAFVFEPAIGALALDLEDDLLEPAQAVLVGVDDLDLPALPLGVARVHAEQVGGEQRGLVAALALAHLDDHILRVVRVARQQQQLDLLSSALRRGRSCASSS